MVKSQSLHMIGVIARAEERKIVKEFFELFKTPWEFYHNQRHYDVVLSSGEIPREKTFSAIFIYDSGENRVDKELNIRVKSAKNRGLLEFMGTTLPIYEQLATFEGPGTALIKMEGSCEVSGLEIKKDNLTFIRIGYDLFQEIEYLLSKGQPISLAYSPTIELHISMLRYSILKSGIPLIEIPPAPFGYDFMACLTHDVDFIGIRHHLFDHTMLGFLYRGMIKSMVNFVKGRVPLKRVLNNYKAVLLLPLVYLGFVKDFWDQIDEYIHIERGLPSTFFFIPYKNRPGMNALGFNQMKRAAKYDVDDIGTQITKLALNKCEIGLHGIDAWVDEDAGRGEFNRIYSLKNDTDIGIRMHWLYFDEQSMKKLDEVGFLYDSTLGYNETVGYRSGTLQVFQHPSAKKVLELPLNIQDTSLFYGDRMDLDEEEAFEVCQRLLRNNIKYGGVVVLNWHHRSLAPERQWRDFYLRIVNMMRTSDVWWTTGEDVVKWFQKRREIEFKEVDYGEGKVRLTFDGPIISHNSPQMKVRVFHPSCERPPKVDSQISGNCYTEVEFENEMEIDLNVQISNQWDIPKY